MLGLAGGPNIQAGLFSQSAGPNMLEKLGKFPNALRKINRMTLLDPHPDSPVEVCHLLVAIYMPTPSTTGPLFCIFWCFMCFNYIKHQKHQLTQDRGYGHNNPSPDPPNKQNKTKNLLRKLNQPRGSLSLSLSLSLLSLFFGPIGSFRLNRPRKQRHL